MLKKETIQMRLDRPRRNAQVRADFLVGEAGCDESEDLRLARRNMHPAVSCHSLRRRRWHRGTRQLGREEKQVRHAPNFDALQIDYTHRCQAVNSTNKPVNIQRKRQRLSGQ